MKNLKIYFSALAFVLAIGASFAFQSSALVIKQGWEQIDDDPSNCLFRQNCNDGTFQCTSSVSGKQLYEKVGTQCSVALKRSTLN